MASSKTLGFGIPEKNKVIMGNLALMLPRRLPISPDASCRFEQQRKFPLTLGHMFVRKMIACRWFSLRS